MRQPNKNKLKVVIKKISAINIIILNNMLFTRMIPSKHQCVRFIYLHNVK